MSGEYLPESFEDLVKYWQIWDHEHRYTTGKGLIETEKVRAWLKDRGGKASEEEPETSEDRQLLADWLMEAAEALGEILTEIRQHPQLFGPDAQRASEVAQALAAVAASWQMVVG